MNLRMGSQTFRDVRIPLLWGSRAVVQDSKGHLSVIDLGGGERARLEILADRPAPGVKFRPTSEGFAILWSNEELYTYNPTDKLLSSSGLRLPDCQVSPNVTRVGTNQFSGNVIVGSSVGIAVSESGIAIGAPMPKGLAELVL